ncbi:transcription factor GTE12-like [Vicia villosa]|uniref:transcription factor GTE12-like n=1 Tax=Vicia villosa TaxID=3911 RepID=UPI00273B0FE3|nr:transcription factor GTE12-like [Vicia villosa]
MSQPKGVKESSKLVKDSSKECVLKKPMECVKRRQCWLILKRMLAGRDGLDLKDPPPMVDNVSESKSLEKKSKAIGLKEIERKLRLYATPDEFASDMRLVFSNAMQIYPPRNHIYQIAKKFSENFELKWKSLKDEWELEDRKRRKAHKSRRY